MMSTFIVYGKGDDALAKVNAISTKPQYYQKSSVKVKPPRWWQYQPRFEARFHDLTNNELVAIKVMLSFIHGITKTKLI